MRNITDYLIEEASAEEEELLGTTDAEDGQIEDTCTIERDDALIKVLDRLLLYLRVVYSVDYYNHCEYPQEDEMPNRLEISFKFSVSYVLPKMLFNYPGVSLLFFVIGVG